MKSSFKINAIIFSLSIICLSPLTALAAAPQTSVERRDLTNMPATWIDLSQVTNSDSRTKLLLINTQVSNGRAAALFARLSFVAADAAQKKLEASYNNFALKYQDLLDKKIQNSADENELLASINGSNFQSDYLKFLLENEKQSPVKEIAEASGVSFAVAIWPLAHPEDIKIIDIASADQLDSALTVQYLSKKNDGDISAWQSLPIDWSFGPSYLVWSIKKIVSTEEGDIPQAVELYRYKISGNSTEKIWNADETLISLNGYEWNDVADIISEYNSISLMGIRRNSSGGYSGDYFRWSEMDHKFLPIRSGFKELKKPYNYDASQSSVLEGSHYIFIPVMKNQKYDHVEVLDKATGKQFSLRIPGIKEITRQFCSVYAEQLVCAEYPSKQVKASRRYFAYDMKTKKVASMTLPLSSDINFVRRENTNLYVNYYSVALNANQLGVFDMRTKKYYELATPSIYTSDIEGLEGTNFVGFSSDYILLSSQLSADKPVKSITQETGMSLGDLIKEGLYAKDWRDFENIFANSPVFATYKINK